MPLLLSGDTMTLKIFRVKISYPKNSGELDTTTSEIVAADSATALREGLKNLDADTRKIVVSVIRLREAS